MPPPDLLASVSRWLSNPIETLSMRPRDYDPFVEVAKARAELREAIWETAPVVPISK